MAKGTTKKAPTAEQLKERADKFKELGTLRLGNAVAAVARLESLANKNSYVYTDEQVKKITDALDAAVQGVKDRFAGKAKPASGISL